MFSHHFGIFFSDQYCNSRTVRSSSFQLLRTVILKERILRGTWCFYLEDQCISTQVDQGEPLAFLGGGGGGGGGVGNQQSKHVRIAHAFLAHQQNYLHLESEIFIGKYVANSFRKNIFQLWSRFEHPWF